MVNEGSNCVDFLAPLSLGHEFLTVAYSFGVGLLTCSIPKDITVHTYTLTPLLKYTIKKSTYTRIEVQAKAFETNKLSLTQW